MAEVIAQIGLCDAQHGPLFVDRERVRGEVRRGGLRDAQVPSVGEEVKGSRQGRLASPKVPSIFADVSM